MTGLNTAVVKAEVEAEPESVEVRITVRRLPHGYAQFSPNAADLPKDVTAALRSWLDAVRP